MKKNYVRRYLLDIQIAKWIFACLTLLIVGYIIYAFFLNKAEHKFNFHSQSSAAKSAIDNNAPEKALLLQAVFHGQDKEGQAFHIKAKRAAQISQYEVKLTDIQADFLWKTNIPIYISSTSGTLKQREKTVELTEQIDIKSADGYTIKADDMLINYATGQVKIAEGVNIDSPVGKITAQELLADKSTETILFKHKVHATLYPN